VIDQDGLRLEVHNYCVAYKLHGVNRDERQAAYVVGPIEMKRLRRSLETDEYHLNYVRRRISRT